ncbi:MAG: cysteine desulfurase [Saccharofermentans sp.]|nr:cysteine desulfurase [Saccharofermentans sp.]
MIYFDNSATTKTSDKVAQQILSDLTSNELFGNPGSLHKLGITSGNAYDEATKAIASKLGCKKEDIIYTSCGTEGANTAIEGYLSRNARAGKTIISTKTEHKATLETLEKMLKLGYNVVYLPVGMDGKPDLSVLESELAKGDTAILCFTHVNNETGAILPIEEIVKIKNKVSPKTVIYLDCVQSLGKLDINLMKLGVDMASFSGHKIHGVKGVGVLYIKTGIRIDPFIRGGGQQGGLRSGTQSLMLADSFRYALEEAVDARANAYEEVSEINAYLRRELLSRGATINSPDDALPFVLNVAFKGFQSETMLHALESFEVYVSTVSACSSKTKKPSYVLLEMGVDRKIAANSVRLSFSRYNTMDEAMEFIKIVDKVYDMYLIG